MPHVVKYIESERGWGTETWFLGYETEKEALEEESKTNSKNTAKFAPNIYTRASYQGFMNKVPSSYKN